MILLTVFAITFLVRFWGIWFDLPEIYTTEEYKVVNYALRMGARRSLNPEFFNYPSLYLYFTLFVSGIYFVIGRLFGLFSSAQDFAYSFIRNPSHIYLIMRFFSAFWSTLSVFMVYLLGKELYNKKTGTLAMLLIAFIPSIIISSHEIRPNIPSLLFVSIAFYFLIKYHNSGTLKYFYLSGIFSGLATSVFYNAFPIALLLVIVYWLRNGCIKIFAQKMWFGIFLAILFFVLGTPYSVLDYKRFLSDFFAHSSGALSNLPRGILGVLNNIIFVGTEEWQIPLLGIFCLISVVFLLIERKKENVILLSALALFSLPVAMYHAPGRGYMLPVVALILISAARFLTQLQEVIRVKWLITIISVILILPSLAETVKLDISYTIKDTRSVAKRWIESHLPFGSKVLVDMYPHSPQIKKTRTQLERLYHRAVELEHYKKEYIKLQIETHPGENYGYEIYRIYRTPAEISGTVKMVEEAQKVQDLIDVSLGFEFLRNKKIQYIIVNSKDKTSALMSSNKALKNFYRNLLVESKLIKEFKPESVFQRGPTIWIYQL